MIGRDFKFHDGKKGAALAIRIVMDAEEDMIRKVLKDGTVVVHLRSNLEDNHDHLLRFLSTELKIDKNRFDIIEGREGIDLLLSILDIEPPEIQKMILERIS